jgi:hypothetical protein
MAPIGDLAMASIACRTGAPSGLMTLYAGSLQGMQKTLFLAGALHSLATVFHMTTA